MAARGVVGTILHKPSRTPVGAPPITAHSLLHIVYQDQPPSAKAPSHSETSQPGRSDTSTADIPGSRRDDLGQLRSDRIETQKRATGFLRRRLPLIRVPKQQASGQTGPENPFGLRLVHASSQPLIDIVFVHGLRGGSTKTWRKGDDVRSFWPQYWLPMEPDLCNASIHSFGYDSDWGSTNPSILNVHDFGQALYEELRSSPNLRQTLDSPIIMIGHSMGGLVIKKGSDYAAVLNRILKISGPGFKNEIARYMNANHREICKFDSPKDPNYVSLKNSLSSAVHNLLQGASREETAKTQLRELQTFLGVSGPPDESHEKVEGSCQWIDDRDDFREWRDAEIDINPNQNCQYTPTIYWVNANPGVGKTVLASHVVSQLAELRQPYAFYHFHVGKNALQLLAGCLRSIAFQMASLNSAIRVTLSNLNDEGTIFDLDDARAIWLKIFKNAIIQTPRITTQYWILDAVDECLGYPELFTFFKGLQLLFPLKIFITSRKLSDFPKLVRQLGSHVIHVIEIPTIDTMRDISLYIRDRMEVLPIDREEDKENLTKEILSKSNASFLWVRLVLDELETVYGYETIMSVLHSIPNGMMSYYRRILTEMKGNKREKHIIQGILIWVVCAARPLTILELTEALRVDIQVHLPSARTAVEGLCGQLVSVDKHTGLVQIVHTTAREFLLSNEAEDFRISRPEANERLALACLQLLGSPAMQPPRHRRLLARKRQEHPSSPLLDYAIAQFSEHIFGSSAESDKLLVALHRFLCTTVLSWIERIAAGKNLHFMIRVARNLKAYLDRRAKYHSPLDRDVNTVACWAADLSRLMTKFGAALVSQPQSIYFLIPPLCPTEAAIYKQFARWPDGLKFSGFTNRDWDDCVATVNFEDDAAAVITCDDRNIAVGFELGNIQLYAHDNYQKGLAVRHAYPIERLVLDPSGVFIASASIKYVAVWDGDGSMLWEQRLRSRCILLTATSYAIICVMMSGKAIWWDIATGEQLEHHQYPYQAPEPLDQLSSRPTKAPFTGSFSPGLELLALAYRTGPICIYELQTHEWIAWAVDDNSRNVTHLVFNPNPDVNLLLVAYDDAHLSLYEPWYGTFVHSQQPETSAVLQSLSCSPDGRTFSTVDAQGNLGIWDFESLTLLYHVLTPTSSFRTLCFTSDGFNLLDVVDQEMRIWAPSILIRKTLEDEGSISDEAVTLPVIAGQYRSFRSAKLRVATLSENSPILVAGNHNGDVMVYDQDGCRTGILYSHSHSVVVKCLALSKGNDIASSDTNGIMQVWQLDTSQSLVARVTKQRFQTQFTTAVRQILFDDEGRYLLVSTSNFDRVYDVATSTIVGSLNFEADERQIWRWIHLPSSAAAGRFVLVCDGKIISYLATTFPSEVMGSQVKLELKVDSGFNLTAIDSIAINPGTSSLILDVSQSRGYLTSSVLLVFQIPELFDPTQASVHVQTPRLLSSTYYMHLLGIDQADCRLFFLHRNSWVCSVKVSQLTDNHYTRHFFVPNEFTTRARDINSLFTRDKALIFALHDKFAVIKNGLAFQEIVTRDGCRDSSP
ncbi:hypothetical protein CHU98_g9844 [Xylaria longipes]|nr:hypothetical protein CHU98_g9844 [Xylaria longipes]